MKLGNQVEQRVCKIYSELILPLSRSNFSFANLFGHFNLPVMRGGMGVKKTSKIICVQMAQKRGLKLV